MSPARQHRERLAVALSTSAETSIESLSQGGQETSAAAVASPIVSSSAARNHRDRVLAQASATSEPIAASRADAGTPEERAAAQMQLRLQHDLRRLKAIQSIAKKIEAKREMLPEYAAWVDGLVAAGAGIAEEVLPTVMIWRIDTGDFTGALSLAEHVLAHDVPLPARYERSAPALIVEEIAEAALKTQSAGAAFPLDILCRVDELTTDADMHDEIRAKLFKAIGVEHARLADAEDTDPLTRAIAAGAALTALRGAQQLHERVGVKDRIKRIEKLLGSPKEPAASAA
jgi:hypothetical protein